MRTEDQGLAVGAGPKDRGCGFNAGTKHRRTETVGREAMMVGRGPMNGVCSKGTRVQG